ncbi:MAG: hypothetical protein IPJ33_04215 [Gammaproteobacteria bacterium]|nr:hypothetical protein [Gammaproteobacteria bacterium]
MAIATVRSARPDGWCRLAPVPEGGHQRFAVLSAESQQFLLAHVGLARNVMHLTNLTLKSACAVLVLALVVCRIGRPQLAAIPCLALMATKGRVSPEERYDQ